MAENLCLLMLRSVVLIFFLNICYEYLLIIYPVINNSANNFILFVADS